MSDLQDLKHLLSLIYIIPSLLLYLAVLYLMFLSKAKHQYSSSFYIIFACSAINYIIHSITYYIIYRLTTIPLLFPFLQTWPTKSLFYPIVFIVMYYTAYANHTYSLILSFNRFTVFILKFRYNNFWKKFLPHFLCFCIFGPLIFVWNFPFLGIQNQSNNSTVAFIGPTITDFAPWMQRSRNLSAEIFVTSVTSFVMNIYVIYSIIKWRYYSSSSSSTTHGSVKQSLSSQDSTMIIYSMFVFSTEAFSCAQQFMLAVDRATFVGFVTSTQFILADMSTLAPVWFILATNRQLRSDVINLLFCSSSSGTPLLFNISSQVSPHHVAIII